MVFRYLLVTLVIALVVAADHPCNFEEYVREFGKDYQPGSQEYITRRKNFEKNCDYINTVNNDPTVTYTLKVNKFVDDQWPQPSRALTQSESPDEQSSQQSAQEDVKVGTRASSVDYSSLIDLPQDQGTCLSSTAFAVTAMYETSLAQRGLAYNLSEQMILECTHNFAVVQNTTNDCTGLQVPDSLELLSQLGHINRHGWQYRAADYGPNAGYPQTDGICGVNHRIENGVGTSTNATYYQVLNAQLRQIVNDQGPVVARVWQKAGFLSYSGGIYTCGPGFFLNLLDHTVLVVGYNDADSYWIIRNSRGTTWGENGFMRLSYSGDCGLLLQPAFLNYSLYYDNPNRYIHYTDQITRTQIILIAVGAALLVALTTVLICCCCGCCCFAAGGGKDMNRSSSSTEFSSKGFISSNPPTSTVPGIDSQAPSIHPPSIPPSSSHRSVRGKLTSDRVSSGPGRSSARTSSRRSRARSGERRSSSRRDISSVEVSEGRIN